MKSFTTLFRIEWKLTVRDFSGILFGVMIPVGLLWLLGFLYGHGTIMIEGVPPFERAVPAVLTIGICATGLMGIPLGLSAYREKQVLQRFQVTPSSPMLLLAVQFFTHLSIALISSGLVLVSAVVGFGYELAGPVLPFVLIYFLVTFSLYTLGLMVASVARNVQMANLLATLLYFPMFFLSGATVPFHMMPGWLQHVSRAMPLTHGIELLTSVSLDQMDQVALSSIAYLLILGILSLITSVRTFKYTY